MPQPKIVQTSKLSPLVFPFHAGPGLRDYGTSLLYFGGITTSVPSFLNPEVASVFLAMGDEAHRTKSILEPTFATALQNWKRGQAAFAHMQTTIENLRPFVTTAFVAYPGDPSFYERWTRAMASARPLARAALSENPLYLSVASKEFAWRVFELASLPHSSPTNVLAALENRARTLDAKASPTEVAHALMEDSLLNRFAVVLESADVRFIVDSSWAIEILTRVDLNALSQRPEQHDVSEADVLAMHLFDVALAPWVPQLSPSGSETLARALSDLRPELDAIRVAFREEAQQLLLDRPSERDTEQRVRDRVRKISDEIGTIANLDKNRLSRFTKSMIEDRVTWSALATIIGSAIADLPDGVAAAGGLAFLTSATANAIKAHHEAQGELSRNRMRFVYHIGKLQRPSPRK